MSQSTNFPPSKSGLDLAGSASVQVENSEPGVKYKVVVDVTAADWQQISELSSKVPVVLGFFSEEDSESSQLEPLLQETIQSLRGKVLFGRVNTVAEPQITQAFQIKQTPAVFALVNGRPLPLFAGIITRSELDQVLSELLQACAQAGVTETLNPVTEDVEENPEPPEEYGAALAARDSGDIEEEVSAWKKIIANNPADKVAEQNLAEASMRLRLSKMTSDDNTDLDQADILFAQGKVEQSFDLFLQIIAEDGEEKETARKRLLEKFTVLGPSDSKVKKARARLASLLF